MKESAKAAAKQADTAKTATDQTFEATKATANGAAKAAAGKAEAAFTDVFGASRNLSFEVPAAVREFAERGVRQAKENYDRFKTVAEEATDVLEDTYTTVAKGFAEVSLKALDTAKDNTDAGFDFARELLGVRSFAEAVELQAAFVRQRLDAGISQAKELTTLVNKIANDSARPVREGFEKSVGQWKQAV